MKWAIALIILILGLSLVAAMVQWRVPAPKPPVLTPLATSTAMTLSSPAFEPNQLIPTKYTCDGDNVSPPLEISDVPAETKSLTLIVDDPDIPSSSSIRVFDHWVVFNISPSTLIINEGEQPGTPGANGRGDAKYTGPCPPDREHRYFFKLYAVDTQLDLPSGATKAQVEQAMNGHVLAETELMGRYDRKR